MSSLAVLENVCASPPGCPDSTCSRVLTMSSGVVRNPDDAPAHTPDAICTPMSVPSLGVAPCVPLVPAPPPRPRPPISPPARFPNPAASAEVGRARRSR